jgi:hypothetical protein
MDESCGIAGFCMAIEAELKTNQARRGGAEGDGNWQSVVRVCSQKVCAWSSDLVASKKSLARTHAVPQAKLSPLGVPKTSNTSFLTCENLRACVLGCDGGLISLFFFLFSFFGGRAGGFLQACSSNKDGGGASAEVHSKPFLGSE